jgi:hypothetical protein
MYAAGTMGEAKRRKRLPCICGTGQPAGDCCWTAHGYHKKPVVVDLHNTGLTGKHDRCYMSATGACDTKISGEHLISHSVLKVLAEKQVEVSGTPWLKPGDKKMLPFSALTTNALCQRHNSLLSPIDSVGAALFEAIQKCGTTDTGPGLLFLLSGHDVERWMLRSLAIFGVSGNFAIDGAVIDQNFVDRLRIVELLEDPKQWKKPLGFYLTRGLGHQFWRRDNIQIAPVVKTGGDEIMGITLDLQGLEFALLAADHDVTGTGLDKALYRPAAFVFDMDGTRHRIQLSWEDGLSHQDVIITWKK